MIGNRALLPGLWWLAQAGLAAANLSQSPLNLVIFAPSVAPGSIAQIRLTLATPCPISAGSVVFNFDPAVFGPPIAVDAFSATGDQNGQGKVTNNQVVASFSSSSGGIGSLPGVPAFIVTLPVLASAPAGATTSIGFLFGGTPWMDAAGNLYNPTAQPVQFTAGGAFSIDSVTPGGGLLPAWTTVRIAGRGFTPTSTVEMDGVPLASTAFISPEEMEIKLGAPFDITGKRVVVRNPGGAQADFYPSLRGAMVDSSQAMLFIFPQQTYVSGGGGMFAVQNPTLEPVDASLLVTFGGEPYQPTPARIPVTLPPFGIFDAEYAPELEQYTGAISAKPIRMLSQTNFSAFGTGGLSVTWAGGPPVCNETDAPVPAKACWLWLAGSPPAVMTLVTADLPFTVTATSQAVPWLRVSADPANGQITLTAAPSLPAGDYAASVTVTPKNPSLLPVTVPFTFRVAKSLVSFVNPPHYLYFTAHQADVPPPPVVLNVTATQAGTPFSVTASDPWILVSPATGVTPATIAVTVDPSAVANPDGRGDGSVIVTGPSNEVSEAVGITVTLPPVVTADPGSLTFWAQAGGSAPAPKTIGVGGIFIADSTVTAETESGGAWLSVMPSTSIYQGLQVAVDATGLGVGTYLGSIILGSSQIALPPVTVHVMLIVWNQAPQAGVMPSSLTLTAPSGTRVTDGAEISVSIGGIPTDFSTSISTDDGNAWLSFAMYTENFDEAAPYGSAYVVASSVGLPPGTYHGTIQITAPVGSPAAISLPVTLNVTAALPVAPVPGPPLAISIVNAASLTAGSVSPGELLAILGLNLAGVQVWFNSIPAPVLYTSATRANVVVPDEISGTVLTSLVMEGGGQRYVSGVPVAASAPAIFTANGMGVGSPSGITGAVARGSAIHLIATGLGRTSPPEVTIGGVNATLVSIGSVANQVAGVFVLDVVVPAGVAPGNAVPVVLTAGSLQSPSGVTIAIR